jgi:hypothetical protein
MLPDVIFMSMTLSYSLVFDVVRTKRCDRVYIKQKYFEIPTSNAVKTHGQAN